MRPRSNSRVIIVAACSRKPPDPGGERLPRCVTDAFHVRGMILPTTRVCTGIPWT